LIALDHIWQNAFQGALFNREQQNDCAHEFRTDSGFCFLESSTNQISEIKRALEIEPLSLAATSIVIGDRQFLR
jgi:hypothetical protein